MNKICGYSCEHNKGGACQITICNKKLIMSDKTELKENYERIYNENCKLREEHNITDISLLDENQELKKKYENAVVDYETTMFEKEQLNSLVNSCQEEIRQLKKQLEDANEQISYLRRSIERKEERIIDLQYERIPYTNEYVDKLLNQQKEFISYLENEKDRLSRECSQIYEDSLGKTRLVNEDIFNEVNDILQKYKSIIGVLDEESNNISS